MYLAARDCASGLPAGTSKPRLGASMGAHYAKAALASARDRPPASGFRARLGREPTDGRAAKRCRAHPQGLPNLLPNLKGFSGVFRELRRTKIGEKRLVFQGVGVARLGLTR